MADLCGARCHLLPVRVTVGVHADVAGSRLSDDFAIVGGHFDHINLPVLGRMLAEVAQPRLLAHRFNMSDRAARCQPLLVGGRATSAARGGSARVE